MTASLEVLTRWIDSQPEEDRRLLQAATGLDQGGEVLPGPMAVGLAVSGGGDSMALLHLLAGAAPLLGFRVEVATVDHRLRPESADEAAFVARTCALLGLRHDTLPWTDHPVTGNLMQAASEARRALLAQWAQQRGLARVAMAHTSDDQAEGFLMALARGTGLDGLCGMRRDWMEHGTHFIRPLLRQSRQELRGYLQRHGLTWREDPTNEDDRYTRSRARKAMAALAPLGIVEGRLTDTMRNLADVRRVLDVTLGGFVERSVQEGAGTLFLRRTLYLDLPHLLRRRFLALVIRWMSGARHPPRSEPLFELSMALRDPCTMTLGGCIFKNGGSQIGIVREPRAVQPRVAATGRWDHRWQVEADFQPGQEIGALGEDGLQQCPDWRETGLAWEMLRVTPAIWQGDTLIAAPCAGFGAATATCAPSFHQFLLSH